MSNIEMNTKAQAYFDLLVQIEALQAEAEAIRDSFKSQMIDLSTEEIEGDGWRATWHNVTSKRLDSKSLKADMPELFAQYSKASTTCRFTLNKLNA